MPMTDPVQSRQQLASAPMESDRSVSELRALDCNLTALCEHIQVEGFSGGSFSDVVVQSLGATFRLHRLVLSRSSYFRRRINENSKQLENASGRNMLHGPWKDAGAPTLNLQIDDDNINQEAVTMALAYLYGHYPKLNDRNAFRVLAVASFLDLQDLCGICTDFVISELWTSNFLAYQIFSESHDYGIHGERVRNACWGYLCQSAAVELREVLPRLSAQTLHALLTSDELWVPSEEKRFELAMYTLLARDTLSVASTTDSDPPKEKMFGESGASMHLMESELQRMNMQNDGLESNEANAPSSLRQDARHFIKVENVAYLHSSFPCSNPTSVHNCDERRKISDDISSIEGPSSDDIAQCQFAGNSSSERRLGQNHLESSNKGKNVIGGEEYEAFNIIFEGGSLLYCHMSFEALLNVRKRLEDLGFPCKTINDGLWLQMLLSCRVQEIAAGTCISCCTIMTQCTCQQSYGYQRQEHGRNNGSQTTRNIYITDAQGDGSSYFAPVRDRVRGQIDGLAGIGRGTWAPTRLVFSRVPLGVGQRNSHQSLADDESESRASSMGDLSGDGLTAVVGFSGGRGAHAIHAEESDVYKFESQDSVRMVPQFSSASVSMQMMEAPEGDLGIGWDDSDASSVSWDLKTALRHFPPFRFGVEFEEVHRLSDGQVKHSPEAFYAGSLWKVSVQAFNNEYPQGRRTLGLFLHRRKAEAAYSLKRAHMYIDPREKVTARYQLICPSKREVMVFGSFKDSGTLLPKAPKGWGWRTAILFDELPDLLQGGALRIVAVVQLV